MSSRNRGIREITPNMIAAAPPPVFFWGGEGGLHMETDYVNLVKYILLSVLFWIFYYN